MKTVKVTSKDNKRSIEHFVVLSTFFLFNGLYSSYAYSQENKCMWGNDILVWKDRGPEKPAPLEKEIIEIAAPNDKLKRAALADVSKFPFSSTGKFLSNVNNERRYCTAQPVEGTDLLLTAAHCVRHKNGIWVDKFEYTPVNPLASNETISDARCIATKSNFVTGESGEWHAAADYAFVLLNAPVASSFSKLMSANNKESIVSIGFPRNVNKGEKLHTLHGELEFDPADRQGGEDAASFMLSDERFGLGISGGGFFSNIGKENTTTIVGLNALVGKDQMGRAVVSGPIFGRCAIELMEHIKNLCLK